MKQKLFIIFLLISILGISQVEADTITVPMGSGMPGTQNYFCIDYTETFAFQWLGYPEYTEWSISLLSEGSYIILYKEYSVDSFFFVPEFAGIYRIVCQNKELTNEAKVAFLHLYDEAPPHANFEVVGGNGSFNETNDTLWDCTKR